MEPVGSQTFCPRTKCPSGHFVFGGHCYYPSFKDEVPMSERKKSWDDARDYCRELDDDNPSFVYDLISLQSEKEYEWMKDNTWSDVYNEWKETFSIWIGLNDKAVEGKWEWSDGSKGKYMDVLGSEPWIEG